MAEKYTLASNLAGNSRLYEVGNGAIHLSDGTLVFLVYSANTVTWILYWTSDRGTINTIASLSALFYNSGQPYAISLCRDSSDNIYVVGADNPNSATWLRVQAFTKNAGHNWTAQTGVQSSLGANTNIYGLDAVWCNTGGGTNSKGHLMVFGGDSNSAGHYWIVDAGVALAGTGTLCTAAAVGVTALTGGALGYFLHVSPDGFGATSGVVVANYSNSTTALSAGAWAVSSTGALTTNTSITSNYTITNFNARIRAVRYGPGLWAAFFGSPTSGRYMAAKLTTSSLINPVDSGTPTNLPLVSTNNGNGVASWDVYLDPTVPNRCWLIVSPNSSGQVYRVSIDMSSGTPVWGTVAVLDDTVTAPSTVLYGMRTVCHPVGTAVDWHIFIQTSAAPNYAFYGDYNGVIGLGGGGPQGRRGFNETIKGRRGRGAFTSFYRRTTGLIAPIPGFNPALAETA